MIDCLTGWQGVDCFDYSKSMNWLVTGGLDHLVRVWSPYVTSKAVAILHGHHMSVQGVKFYEALDQLFSYSRDCVSHTQTVQIVAYSTRFVTSQISLVTSRYEASVWYQNSVHLVILAV